MIMRIDPESPGLGALELFRPQPHVFYNLDATAMLAGVTRRSILMYCRSGLLTPSIQPPYGVMMFTQEAIHAVRRVERVRLSHGFDHAWLAAMLEVVDELECLRAELRALRSS
jgi:DNA-binding transcriptional MerR regulator